MAVHWQNKIRGRQVREQRTQGQQEPEIALLSTILHMIRFWPGLSLLLRRVALLRTSALRHMQTRTTLVLIPAAEDGLMAHSVQMTRHARPLQIRLYSTRVREQRCRFLLYVTTLVGLPQLTGTHCVQGGSSCLLVVVLSSRFHSL
jgi:hypothetical protein